MASPLHPQGPSISHDKGTDRRGCSVSDCSVSKLRNDGCLKNPQSTNSNKRETNRRVNEGKERFAALGVLTREEIRDEATTEISVMCNEGQKEASGFCLLVSDCCCCILWGSLIESLSLSMISESVPSKLSIFDCIMDVEGRMEQMRGEIEKSF